MTTTPKHLLEAAEKIAKMASDEALFRASINRSYYASYHACREFYASLPHLADSVGAANGVHEQLIHNLLSPSKKITLAKRTISVVLGKYLRSACDKRAKADYRIAENISQNEKDDTLMIAKDIFDNV